MRIVPEKVFVHVTPETGEMLLVMDGFRLTLSQTEGQLLRDGLTLGLTQLSSATGDVRRPVLIGAPDGESSEKKLSEKKLIVMPA